MTMKAVVWLDNIKHKTEVEIRHLGNYMVLDSEHASEPIMLWIDHDALKLTFSSGNHTERQRLINIVEEGEKIIDMFACVGNLSIPISVHHPESKVIR